MDQLTQRLSRGYYKIDKIIVAVAEQNKPTPTFLDQYSRIDATLNCNVKLHNKE